MLPGFRVLLCFRDFAFSSSTALNRGFCSGEASRATGCPGPSEVVTSYGTEGVEDLAAQKEPAMAFAFQRAWINFVEGDAATRDFSLLVTLVSTPRQLVRGKAFDERRTLMAPELVGFAIRRDAGFFHQREGEALRQLTRERRRNQSACVG